MDDRGIGADAGDVVVPGNSGPLPGGVSMGPGGSLDAQDMQRRILGTRTWNQEPYPEDQYPTAGATLKTRFKLFTITAGKTDPAPSKVVMPVVGVYYGEWHQNDVNCYLTTDGNDVDYATHTLQDVGDSQTDDVEYEIPVFVALKPDLDNKTCLTHPLAPLYLGSVRFLPGMRDDGAVEKFSPWVRIIGYAVVKNGSIVRVYNTVFEDIVATYPVGDFVLDAPLYDWDNAGNPGNGPQPAGKCWLAQGTWRRNGDLLGSYDWQEDVPKEVGERTVYLKLISLGGVASSDSVQTNSGTYTWITSDDPYLATGKDKYIAVAKITIVTFDSHYLISKIMLISPGKKRDFWAVPDGHTDVVTPPILRTLDREESGKRYGEWGLWGKKNAEKGASSIPVLPTDPSTGSGDQVFAAIDSMRVNPTTESLDIIEGESVPVVEVNGFKTPLAPESAPGAGDCKALVRYDPPGSIPKMRYMDQAAMKTWLGVPCFNATVAITYDGTAGYRDADVGKEWYISGGTIAPALNGCYTLTLNNSQRCVKV